MRAAVRPTRERQPTSALAFSSTHKTAQRTEQIETGAHSLLLLFEASLAWRSQARPCGHIDHVFPLAGRGSGLAAARRFSALAATRLSSLGLAFSQRRAKSCTTIGPRS
jgi:hypothetical protein